MRLTAIFGKIYETAYSSESTARKKCASSQYEFWIKRKDHGRNKENCKKQVNLSINQIELNQELKKQELLIALFSLPLRLLLSQSEGITNSKQIFSFLTYCACVKKTA